jgi:ATP-dependent exoDNAse (exonuclease V) beta subunit
MISNIEVVKYSIVLFYSTKFNKIDIKYIKELLNNGIKVIIFLNKGVDQSNLIEEIKKEVSDLDKFKGAKLLQLYELNKKINKADTFIVDGKEISKLDIIANASDKFNFEQYKVEHMSKDANIAIEAGAGTGKTTVMIDRVMYLLHMEENINLDDIIMITFTREATQNMRHKLQKALLTRYKLTKKERYLNYIEQESKMSIKTIHSFAKYLISKLGTISGYGTNVEIRSFKHDRNELILNILDRYLNESDNIKNYIKMELYKFKDIIDIFWNKLETEGISYGDIESFDWGTTDDNSKTIHEIIKKIFKDLEQEFSEIKRLENAVSLKDITRELDYIIKANPANKKGTNLQIEGKIKPIKYLFVDEFQDTDNTQIDLLVWVYKNLNTRVFVVGDIKQSIYRFRGATYTAFKELNSKIKDLESESLVKNYRTSYSILNKLHPVFGQWNKDKLLVYKAKDELIPMSREDGEYRIVEINSSKDIKDQSKKLFREYLNKLNSNSDKENSSTNKVVALVRTNYQASQIKDWCMEENIPCYVEVGGTFFISEAVRDCISLVGAYTYTEEPAFKINLINSPYIKNGQKLNWRELWQANGDKKQINSILDNILNDYENKYKNYKEDFRTKPVLQVIKNIIRESNVVNNYYSRRLYELNELSEENNKDAETQARMDAIRYYKNLNKLLELIKKKFSEDFCSLHNLYNYLILNMNTNRDEDEVSLHENEIGESLYCMTVHKSKGLEFNTVILPFMDRKFRKKNELEILVDMSDEKSHKVGWNIPYSDYKSKHKNNSYQNHYYNELQGQEKDEVSKEEARLLYVALTRSISNLVCIKLKRFQETWSSLL